MTAPVTLAEILDALDEVDAAIEDQRFGWSERKDSAFSRLTRLRKRGREYVESSEP